MLKVFGDILDIKENKFVTLAGSIYPEQTLAAEVP